MKVSQLIVISLLLLVGCSTESSNKSNSDLPSSDDTGVAESDISGCWERSKFNADGASSGYWKETYKLEPGGSFSRESIANVSSGSVRIEPEPHNDSGKWIIDDGYVVIQFEDGGTVTLKVVSKYELVQVGSSVEFAFRRC
jgi:hypothetical protein